MENPEEVLQALDEFQKMRPTEIPRELEDYLCWVAKTGDPVYQWSLIKALFREKLTRVMTDFYESCPSLDLAPCPNVETFNYDTMKCSLLERLESFANAPFTVQRICELLTAPRKEYNRVDKFMRAIEKNILVVSTKEPGSTVRRNENGDGMVNGSVEDDAPSGESHEVEMESWVKDCAASTVGMSVQTMENEARLLEDVTTTMPKTGPATNGVSLLSQEKTEHVTINTCESSGLNFVPSTSEFSNQGSESRDSVNTGLGTQSLSTSIVHEAPSIAREVPEAIINEDTSSQPSLDMDSPESEPADPNRKLQTTFQAKDFITHEKSPELLEKGIKISEKSDDSEVVSEVSPVENSSESLDECSKLKRALDERVSVLPNMKNFLQVNTRLENSVIISEGTPIDQKSTKISEDEETNLSKKNKDIEPENSPSAEQNQPVKNNITETPSTAIEENIIEEKAAVEPIHSTCDSKEIDEKISTKTDTVQEVDKSKEQMVEESNEESCKSTLQAVEETNEEVNIKLEKTEAEIISEDIKPVIEETPSEKNDADDSSQDSQSINVTIEETTEDDASETKSLVPDPIPIIEEPKEVKPVIKYCEKETSIEEVESKTLSSENENLPKNEPVIIETVENNEATTSEKLSSKTNESTETKVLNSEENPIPQLVPHIISEVEKEARPDESMEIDGEESAIIFQGEEPMEEEMSEVSSS